MSSPLDLLQEVLTVEGFPPLCFDRPTLERLIDRIHAAPLFAHAYSFYFHLADEVWSPQDLLEFAAVNGFAGVKCHLEDGESKSFVNSSPSDLQRLGARAREQGLRWHVETSSTVFSDLARATEIANNIGAESIRCYSRYSGSVSSIIARVTDDMRRFRKELDPASQFQCVLEQHEDLTSHEMVKIVEEVNDPDIRLLFDTANMVNAGERPLEAWYIQAPWVSEIHLKDARILEDRGGWAQFACRTGTGDIPLARLLVEVLLAGEHERQVSAIGLEEEVNLFSPAYRFPNEGPDPIIPHREMSQTGRLPQLEDTMLRQIEYRDAVAQLNWVRNLLEHIRNLAGECLEFVSEQR